MARDAREALEGYASRRTHDQKGITIPSQIRYVKLYATAVKGLGPPKVVRLHSAARRVESFFGSLSLAFSGALEGLLEAAGLLVLLLQGRVSSQFG